jgi:hypothetical protein
MCAVWSKTWVSCSKGVTLLVGCIFGFHSFRGCYSTCWYVTTVLFYGNFPFTRCVNESCLPFTCFSFITASQILVKFCIMDPVKSFGRILLLCMLDNSNPCFPCNLNWTSWNFFKNCSLHQKLVFCFFLQVFKSSDSQTSPQFPPNFVPPCVWHLSWAPCSSFIYLLCFFLLVSYSKPPGISTSRCH